MNLIKLKHDRRTRYFNFTCQKKTELSFLRDTTHTTIITFRNLILPNIKYKIYEVNGTSRYTTIFNEDDIFLYNIQSDSPLYAQIFWDIAHRIKLQRIIYTKEVYNTNCFLEKLYFKESFREIEISCKQVRAFQKINPLIIESERGLDEWTFGIPVGPEDPLFLNRCVERILDLEIEKKEIILCGKPHKRFKYFDKVKIINKCVSFPVHITRKKNILANNASLKNLCIIHERIMLPKNFLQAMKNFGDDFPITGLQSFFFVDKKNLKPRRYSDFGTLCEDITQKFDINTITKKDMMRLGRKGMFCQSVLRKNFGYDYITGSLYICKSKLWKYCPQNESLYWDDFEDVEYSIRAASFGIPVIINPYSITQSMSSRSIMHHYGYLSGFSHSGKLVSHRAITEVLPFVHQKPLFKITIQEAKLKLFHIAKKYKANSNIFNIINQQSFSSQSRLKTIIALIKSIKIPLWEIEQFVADFERDVLCESMPPLYRSDLIDVLQSSVSVSDKKNALIKMPFLYNQVSHTLFYSPFVSNTKDWFIKKTFLQNLFNKISAIQLKYLMNGVYLKLSIMEINALVDETTPYLSKENNED